MMPVHCQSAVGTLHAIHELAYLFTPSHKNEWLEFKEGGGSTVETPTTASSRFPINNRCQVRMDPAESCQNLTTLPSG